MSCSEANARCKLSYKTGSQKVFKSGSKCVLRLLWLGCPNGRVNMTKAIVIFQEKKVRDRNVVYMNPVARFAALMCQLYSLQKGGTH